MNVPSDKVVIVTNCCNDSYDRNPTSVTSVRTTLLSNWSQDSPSVGHDHCAALAATHRNAIPADTVDDKNLHYP